ncbi:AMP-binding protein [Streptomyces canus]|nr:AMP-binding protein [Streptomyces canus]
MTRAPLDAGGAAAAPRLEELVRHSANRVPDRTALRIGPRRVSYAELRTTADSWAEVLRSAHPEGEPRSIGILADRTFTGYVGILAAMCAGAAVIPLPPDLPGRPAHPGGGRHRSVAPEEPVFVGQLNGDGPGEGEVAVTGEEAASGQMDGGQRGRAQAADVHAGTAQAQVVRDPQGQRGGVAPLVQVGLGDRVVRIRESGVAVLAAAAEDADPHVGCVGPARILQGVHRFFEEQAVLRVHGCGLGGCDAEVLRVEEVDAVERSGHRYPAGSCGRGRGVGPARTPDRRLAAQQPLPVGVHVLAAGEPSGEADDRYGVGGVGIGHGVSSARSEATALATAATVGYLNRSVTAREGEISSLMRRCKADQRK